MRLIQNATAGIVTVLLAACSSTGGNSPLPAHESAPNAASRTDASQRANRFPRRVIGTDGHVRQILYTRQIELAKRAGSDATSAPADGLQYWGGPIQTKPQIYVVYWGDWSTAADPAGERAYLDAFLKDAGSSKWLRTVTQYTQGGGGAVGKVAHFQPTVHAWNDASPVPDLSDGATYSGLIAAEVQKAAQHFNDSTTDASYVIATPHNTPVSGFGTYFCAWHSYTAVNGVNVAYTTLPYIPDAGFACGQGFVTSPGYDDGVSIVEGHEQAETETDPQLNAWFDDFGNEIGDKCAWIDLQNTKFSSAAFPTQPLWSNATDGCVQ